MPDLATKLTSLFSDYDFAAPDIHIPTTYGELVNALLELRDYAEDIRRSLRRYQKENWRDEELPIGLGVSGMHRLSKFLHVYFWTLRWDLQLMTDFGDEGYALRTEGLRVESEECPSLRFNGYDDLGALPSELVQSAYGAAGTVMSLVQDIGRLKHGDLLRLRCLLANLAVTTSRLAGDMILLREALLLACAPASKT